MSADNQPANTIGTITIVLYKCHFGVHRLRALELSGFHIRDCSSHVYEFPISLETITKVLLGNSIWWMFVWLSITNIY